VEILRERRESPKERLQRHCASATEGVGDDGATAVVEDLGGIEECAD
jgi:serine/threonine protein phosphatase PrpC